MSALRAFGSLFGRQLGNGAPRVLGLHGWARTSADLVSCLEGLDAIVVDLPGFGATPAPDTAMGARGYADTLMPLFESFERPPVLLGHSFGGRVAVDLASRHQVAGLVLSGVPLLRRMAPARPAPGFRAVRLAHRYHLVSDERMERLRKSRGSPDYRNATGVMRDVLVRVVNESYETQLAALDCPVRLVWGAEDRQVPVSVAHQAAEMLRGRMSVSVEVVPGAGHMLVSSHPDVIASAVAELCGR